MKKQRKPRPGKKKQQTYTRPSIEQENAALAWATEYFRRDKLGLEKGIPDEIREKIIGAAIIDHDRAGKDSVFARYPMSVPSEFEWVLRGASTALMLRDRQLPDPLADFTAAFVHDPNLVSFGKPGRKYTDSLMRYVSIGIAVDHVAKKWGFSRTRNRHNTTGVCAVSIV